jgi:hypothetical protein
MTGDTSRPDLGPPSCAPLEADVREYPQLGRALSGRRPTPDDAPAALDSDQSAVRARLAARCWCVEHEVHTHDAPAVAGGGDERQNSASSSGNVSTSERA